MEKPTIQQELNELGVRFWALIDFFETRQSGFAKAYQSHFVNFCARVQQAAPEPAPRRTASPKSKARRK